MYASVELQREGETVILPARNISLGGVFLTADRHDLTELEVGMSVEVLVFDALNEKNRPVRLAAQVVRRDETGMALMWTSTDSDAALRLAKLLGSMQPKADKK
jgi:hypothetical protein